MFLNARSIVYKIDELRAVVSTHKPDFIMINETWLNEEHMDQEFSIDGFNLITRKDGTDTQRGVARGILLYSREGIDALPYRNDRLDEFREAAGMQIRIPGESEPLTAIMVYRPPRLAFSNDDNMNTAKLCAALNSLPKDTLMVCATFAGNVCGAKIQEKEYS